MTREQRNEDQRRKFAVWQDASERAAREWRAGNGNEARSAAWEARCAMVQWMDASGVGAV